VLCRIPSELQPGLARNLDNIIPAILIPSSGDFCRGKTPVEGKELLQSRQRKRAGSHLWGGLFFIGYWNGSIPISNNTKPQTVIRVCLRRSSRNGHNNISGAQRRCFSAPRRPCPGSLECWI